MKKLCLFLDGTWNEPGDNTNVWRMKVMLASHDNEGIPQVGYYDTGVGTAWHNRMRGGTVGMGLSTNVREAYQWLVENYDPDDEIFIFGFSRGAYTARSIAGMIVKCGLLYPGVSMTTMEVFKRYQLGKEARPIYTLEFARSEGQALNAEEERLLANSRRIPIKMIGVWDTVGAMGIPWTQAPMIGRGKFYFHNTNLSVLFENAYHALAVDENRAPYKPTLWTKFTPESGPGTDVSRAPPQNVEQRWFVGAHSNVGGGYEQDELAQIPLRWLQQKAGECGLRFRNQISLSGDEILCDPRDSYKEFMKGAYRAMKFGKRFWRPIGAAPREVKGGTSEPVNEWIDASVFERYQKVSSYRPQNLEQWAQGKNIDLSSYSGDSKA